MDTTIKLSIADLERVLTGLGDDASGQIDDLELGQTRAAMRQILDQMDTVEVWIQVAKNSPHNAVWVDKSHPIVQWGAYAALLDAGIA